MFTHTGNKKLSVLVVLFLIATLLLQGCSGTSSTKSTSASSNSGKTMSTDVVVVGSGTTGLSASIQAKQLGLNVIMLEKMGIVGGTSNSAEGYGAINSDFAEKKGYHYDVQKVWKTAEEFHHWANDSALLLKYYEHSGESANWLQSLGVEFDDVQHYGNAPYNTWHLYTGTGKQFTKTLADNAKKMGVKILLETRGKELIMKNGKVAGIKAKQSDGSVLTIKAPVVILATGGYAANPEMIKEYAKVEPNKQVADAGMPDSRTGDGINMALKVGASDSRLKGSLMVFGLFVKGQETYGPINSMGWVPMLRVNQDGNRFEDESLSLTDWGTNGNALKQQKDVYQIVTKATLDRYAKDGFPDWIGKIPNFYDALNKYMKMDKGQHIFTADSLDELASKMHVNKTQLKATLDQYNSYCKTGVDSQFGTPANFLVPVDNGPYYVFKYQTGYFATTDGLEVTADAQVLDKKGKVIPGLYAGGSDAGGLNGESYEVNVVPGSQQGWAVNSGRFAAKDAANYLKK